ncbi:hypothetical protein [Cupriavidus oxalaticus]|uniref:hypothetical protein n=1 Tax=Cupriavidus oxalaticus TaxID=96344 RepID=UPI00316B7DFC
MKLARMEAVQAAVPQTAWVLWCLLGLPAILLIAPVRETLEASMALQMLVEVPILSACGFAASAMLARRHRERPATEAVMRLGLAPLLGASLCLMFWMVPLALDLARLDAGVNGARYVSLMLAGVSAEHGLRRAPAAVLLFFGGNLIWTLATVGMLFHDADSRLCANYLLPDQRLAGTGLIVYAVAVTVGLALYLRRQPGFGFSSSPPGQEGDVRR